MTLDEKGGACLALLAIACVAIYGARYFPDTYGPGVTIGILAIVVGALIVGGQGRG